MKFLLMIRKDLICNAKKNESASHYLVALMTLSLQVSQVYAKNYSSMLKGKRLVLEGAICVCLEFKANSNTVLLYAEMECSKGIQPTLEVNVKWFNKKVACFHTLYKTRLVS